MDNDTAPARPAFRVKQANALPFWRARGAPELAARRVSRAMLAVRCPHCQVWHYHGDAGELPAHRLAHCKDVASPLLATGYILAEIPGEAA